MNKYQKALSRMYDNLDYASYYYLDDKCDDDYDILCELIDKATPKKPIYSDFEEVDDNIYIPNTAKCPTCGNEFEFGEFNDIDSHHCVCGQAMDWSED